MSIPKSQEAVYIRKEIALNMISQDNLQLSQVANLGIQIIKFGNEALWSPLFFCMTVQDVNAEGAPELINRSNLARKD